MNIKSLNARSVLEAASAAAVLLGLIFVGLEMDENTRATRSAIAAETTATIAEWYTSLGSDQQVSSVFRRFITDPQSLTAEEQYQAVMTLHSLMLILQSSFYLEEEGTLSPQIRRSVTQSLIAAPGVRFYWEQRKAIFVNEAFIAYVERVMAGENTHSEALYRSTEER